MEITTEKELIEAIIARKREARLGFFKSHRDALYATACHFLGSQDPEAEKIVLEVIDWAFMNMPSYKGKPSLEDWVNQRCVLESLKVVRRRLARLAEIETEISEVKIPVPKVSGGKSPDEKRTELIRRATKQQPDGPYELLVELETNGKPIAEVCKIAKKPLGAMVNLLIETKENIKMRVENAAAEL